MVAIAGIRSSDGLALLLMITGCDTVFGLHRTENIDASGDGPGELACVQLGNDEDQDDADDGCDNCPWVGDPSFPDRDMDQVGDACDPRPTLGGDSLVDFISFTEGDSTRWAGDTNWTLGDGVLRFDNFAGSSVIQDTRGQLPAAFIVVAHVVIDALPPGSEYSTIGILANVSGTNDVGVTCMLAENASNRQFAAAWDPFDGIDGDGTNADIAIQPGAGYLFRFTYDPNRGEAICDIQRDNGGPRVLPRHVLSPSQPPPHLGFEGIRIQAHVDFAAVYLRVL